ncbi:MAG: PhnD/SsuA/transferrin family substrate-binding protein [Thiogranum sp.]|nr:PhnD/SsuA/transferrin family substrate-binding protein [Thiogranum sp.]
MSAAIRLWPRLWPAFVILVSLHGAPAAGPAPAPSAIEQVRIGVLAYRGEAHAMRRWSPTADYLSAAVPGYRFEIVPVDLDEMAAAIEEDRIHFTLTNPGNYVELETRFGVSRIATLQTREGRQTRVRYGAVIVARADDARIKTLADLRGKSFMAVSADAFGGFQMAWRELKSQGIDPFRDLKSLAFSGFPQDEIVAAVHSGRVDAATVRAETLARMVEAGRVQPASLRVLNPQSDQGTPFPVSTRLYPEWPFATLRTTARELATQVARALLSMPENHPAAKAAHSAGWTVPLDYSPVHALMEELKIGPYEALRGASLAAMAKRYAYWLAGAGTVLLSLLLISGYVSRTNHRLKETERNLRDKIRQHKRSQQALARYRDTLEEQVARRTDDLQATNLALEKSRVALRELVRITSAPELSHDEKLMRLLDTGRAYYGLPVGVLASLENDRQNVCRISGERRAVLQTGPISRQCAALLVARGGEPLDIPDLAASTLAETQCVERGWRSYLGAAVLVEGRVHCTLEFAGRGARAGVFSQWDHDLLKVMAQWIGDELERQVAWESEQQHRSELARVSRISTVGEMAASLAHELNQPLTGTINYSSGCLRLLRDGIMDRRKLMEGMERAVEGAKMAADIIRHIREFVQKGDARRSAVNLNSAVRNVTALVGVEARRHDVAIELDLADDLPLVEGSLIQLEQVILNFLRNGIDAMEGTKRGQRRLIVATRREGGSIRVTATDTGEGIPQAALARIFDAFYTTKTDGVGIGLSISRSIIESHRGHIAARTLEGGGAEFSFRLPVAEGT